MSQRHEDLIRRIQQRLTFGWREDAAQVSETPGPTEMGAIQAEISIPTSNWRAG